MINTVALEARWNDAGRGINRYGRLLSMVADTIENSNHTLKIVRFDPETRLANEHRRFTSIPGKLKHQLWFNANLDIWSLGRIASLALGTPKIVHTSGFRLVELKGAHSIYTVYDLPWLHGYEYANMLRDTIERAIHRADTVVAISETTRQDVLTLGIPPEKVKVIYPAVESVFFEGLSENTDKTDVYFPDRFYLYVGAVSATNKNFERILKAIRRLGDQGLPLVVVGPEDPRKAFRLEKAGVHVIYLGLVSDLTLISLYDKAVSLVFPSLFEGFGYPIVEAFARGCPVITSNSGATKEVSMGAALEVDPLNIEDIANALSKTQCEVMRAELLSRGKIRAADFQIATLSGHFYDLYRSILCYAESRVIS